jgi:hypothetical protein
VLSNVDRCLAPVLSTKQAIFIGKKKVDEMLEGRKDLQLPQKGTGIWESTGDLVCLEG